MPNQTLHDFHFSCGNSTKGLMGLCGQVQATDKGEALRILQDVLPPEVEVRPTGEDENNVRVDYLRIYLSPRNLTLWDCDQVDGEDCEVESHFMIVGLYADSQQRFAESVLASDPKEAERLFREDHPDIVIAGVIAGDHLEVVG